MRDPSPVIEALAGVPAPPAPMRRQANGHSAAWVARYHAETAQAA
ncbi:hypothetical protein [Solirubrobacter deserti]|uniref:Uncharacterized protein n=1 Tax=Solirubrobacter deserti TaxID=2282478 RepID=A0ABT4RIH9_9ACTN|nr:hypothetical protein [Solirubrobacter deserti]MDA0138341.1 hypothetical protein [Solirubrobacter deserti]